MILIGHVLEELHKLESESVDCVVTSPPYWNLRDYGLKNQLGLEPEIEKYVENMVEVFNEIKRVLKPNGSLWLNLGDTYVKKNLMGVPWKIAFALQNNGWYLRQDIIWHKPNPMPESVKNRCTKSHEYIFLLTKNPTYYFNYEAFQEKAITPAGTKAAKGSKERYDLSKVNARPPRYAIYNGKRNKRSVWTIKTKPFKGAHFAVMPEALVEPCILAGCPENGLVLDPFFGSGTVGVVALKNNRNYIGIELNPHYAEIAKNRLRAISQ